MIIKVKLEYLRIKNMNFIIIRLIVAIFIVLCLEIYDMSLLFIYTLSKYVKLQFIFLLSENNSFSKVIEITLLKLEIIIDRINSLYFII
jgi:hypothetical protein